MDSVQSISRQPVAGIFLQGAAALSYLVQVLKCPFRTLGKKFNPKSMLYLRMKN